jgi:hypothetical protein
VIYLCPSNNNKDSEFLDELSLSKFDNIEFHIFKASQNGKAIKIAEVLKIIDTDYVGIIDADHSISPDWCTESFKSLGQAGANCVCVQGIRKLKGKKNLISLWDSFSNHFLNEVQNILLASRRSNVPFTGTSALFKTYILRDIPILPHLTEDTNWFMRFRRLTKKFICYQNISATYEELPTNIQNFISRRIRWATGHTQSYLQTIRMKAPFNLNYHLHGLFYIVGALIYMTLVLRAIFIFFQFEIHLQLIYILILIIAFFSRYHVVMALFPYFVLITAMPIFHNNFIQDVILIPELSTLVITIYILFLLLAILISGGRKLFVPFYSYAFLFFPFFIVIELYASFVGLMNLQNKEQVWNIHKKNYFLFINYLLLALTIGVSTWQNFDYLKASYQLINPDKPKDNKIKIVGQKIFFKDKPLNNIRGIAVSGSMDSKQIDRVKKAGFNTLRFYSVPQEKILQETKKAGLNIIMHTGDNNWSNLNLLHPFDYIKFQLNYLFVHQMNESFDNILFPSFGNEIELWPKELEQVGLEEGLSSSKQISIKLDGVFKKFQDSNHIFTYSTVFYDNALDFKSIPILMFNGNSFNYHNWISLQEYIRNQNKPTLIGEWGGSVPYSELNNFYEPFFIKNFLIEKNYYALTDSSIAGAFYFALSDLKALPEMNKYTDPFKNSGSKDHYVGILDFDGKPKDAYWIFAELFSDFEVKATGNKVLLTNKTTAPIKVNSVNTHDTSVLLQPGARIFFEKSFFNKYDENIISYEKSGELITRALFHGNGYETACLGTIFTSSRRYQNKIQFDLPEGRDDRYFAIVGERNKYNIENPNDFLILRSLDHNLSVLLQKHGTKLDIEVYGHETNVSLHQLIPCRRGSPFL